LPAILEHLERSFETAFTIVDVTPERAIDPRSRSGAELPDFWSDLCRQVALRGRAEFIASEEPLLALAIPLPDGTENRTVAVGLFLSAPFRSDAHGAIIEQALCWSRRAVETWARKQSPWSASRLLSLADAVHRQMIAELKAETLAKGERDLSANISLIYEEISLLHRLTQNLQISRRPEELAQQTLQWLAEPIPADTLVLELSTVHERSSKEGCGQSLFLIEGARLFDLAEFQSLVKSLGLSDEPRSVVINLPLSAELHDRFPALRQAVVVPLSDGQRVFGWLGAFNHRSQGEFGSPEASLLGSVSAILAVHASNTELYRQQAEFLTHVVRALTSAIDAKDPYTCGHSERVARVAVALAEELGCSRSQCDTIYLSGLLHDIGKIGIDDSVLRKTGRLTDAEFEHIKIHTEIGHKILADLEQLGDVLPVVRHHHEAWNGAGYPLGLAGEQIPLLARIAAVADAFDAMQSDRPYRKGMPDDRLDEIFRQGAGTQWDPQVIDAFFRIRGQIRELIRRASDSEPVTDAMRHIS
jgi:HD-GYP domain-containing protein (c-di-GMP phosphodiesterase class II)